MIRINRFVTIAAVFFLAVSFGVSAEEHAPQKAVLVTGASSGIGLKITEHLAKAGFYVYAGARKAADLERLDAMDNVSSVRLDVTEQSDIDAAVKYVESQGRGLFGVINNAGVASFSRMSETTEDTILWIHDVNVMGPHRINQAFIPLLTASGGRTAIIGSISGFLTSARGGAYSMSKFAVEAYTEALASDLAESGITVGIIEPGSYKSRIWEKVTMYSMTRSDDLSQTVNDEQRARLQAAKDQVASLKEPDEVAEAAVRFMSSDSPQFRYMVVPNKDQADITIRTAIGRVIQLNASQPYELSRDELVALVDELLKEKDET